METAQYFRMSNGVVIKSLEELPLVLEYCPDDVFYFHVTPYKNDFAKWAYDVFRDVALSQILGQTKSKEETIRVLKAYFMQKAQDKPQAAQEPAEVKPVEPKPVEIKPAEVKPQQAAPNILAAAKKRIFVWNTGQSTAYDPTSKVNRPTAVLKNYEAPKPVQQNPQPASKPITDAQIYFEQNPVTIDNRVDARKRALQAEDLPLLNFSAESPPDNVLDVLKTNYAKAYERLTLLRKSGFPTSIAELMLSRIPPKLKVFETSGARKDLVVALRYVNELLDELNTVMGK